MPSACCLRAWAREGHAVPPVLCFGVGGAVVIQRNVAEEVACEAFQRVGGGEGMLFCSVPIALGIRPGPV